ncbi:hypothetical protein L3X37_05255 [Sabulilitoribacter arenilitoris]|uniref:N-sulphoglucosamine sulphohydrolase C-terminal domain-containing protein n=1 Tax=Wocania arenilitoris TaxID=2044858 RepID=A0AAE3JL41_9FLAO|nr:sulfatase/phosphatase domain-containing protein [Wocania arenilitoris]MCF7567772.1 hypothetical protein [Wocania arenilitoris]
MQWKGMIKEGSVCEQIAASIDFYPTLAKLINIDLKEERIIDGVDITNLLLGKKNRIPRKEFFYMDQNRGLKAIRSENWKLFLGEKPILYNLKDDIGERQNVAEKHTEIVKQLTQRSKDFEESLNKNKRRSGLIPIEQ